MNIFFDLDGTLIDIKKKYYLTHKAASRTIDLKILPLNNYWEFKKNKIPEKNFIRSNRFNEYEKLRISLLEELQSLDQDKLFEQSEEVLKYLNKNHTLILLTARKNENNLKLQLTKLKIINYFDKILSGDPKSDSVNLKINLIKNSKLKTDKSLIIGDTETDIITGKKLGFTTIAVLTGIRNSGLLQKYEPDFIIDRIEALPKIIDNL